MVLRDSTYHKPKIASIIPLGNILRTIPNDKTDSYVNPYWSPGNPHIDGSLYLEGQGDVVSIHITRTSHINMVTPNPES